MSPFSAGVENHLGCHGMGGPPLHRSGAVGCSLMLWDEKGDLKPPGAAVCGRSRLSARRGCRLPGGVCASSARGLYRFFFSPFTLRSLGLAQALAPCPGGTHVSASLAAVTGWGGNGMGFALPEHTTGGEADPTPPLPSVGAGVALPRVGFGAISPRDALGVRCSSLLALAVPCLAQGEPDQGRRMLQQEPVWTQNTSDLNLPVCSAPLLPTRPPAFPQRHRPGPQRALGGAWPRARPWGSAGEDALGCG